MGYKGVSFPFQLNKKGGILLSDTTVDAPIHLTQGLEQLFNTRRNERVMETDYFCPLEETLFEEDESAETMIKSIMVDAVENLEERVTLEEDDIEIVHLEDGIQAIVTYTAEDLGIEETIPVNLGGAKE